MICVLSVMIYILSVLFVIFMLAGFFFPLKKKEPSDLAKHVQEFHEKNRYHR